MSERLALAAAALAATLAAPCAFAAGPEELAAALRERFPEVKRVQVAPLSKVPAGEIEIPAQLALDKRIQTWVSATGRDGRPRRLSQWWSVKAFAPVLVARRALRSGEPVRSADIATEERDVAGAGGALLSADPGFADARWRTTRFIQPGAPLRRADVEPAPEVLRGQQVRVSLVSELFTIETTGVARDEGRLGSVIAVMRPGAAEPYFAEVTGEGEVQVRGKP